MPVHLVEGITPEAATAALNSLPPIRRDLVGSIALGLSNDEMATRSFFSPNTVQAYVSRMYRTLGVARLGVREISSAGHLLKQAYQLPEEEESLPMTRGLIEENKLTFGEVRIMDTLRLRLQDLELLKMLGEGMSFGEISQVFSLETSTVRGRKAALSKQLGEEGLNMTVAFVDRLVHAPALQPEPVSA